MCVRASVYLCVCVCVRDCVCARVRARACVRVGGWVSVGGGVRLLNIDCNNGPILLLLLKLEHVIIMD